MAAGRWPGAAVLLLLCLAPSAVRAQAATPRPPGPFVVDVRGSTLGVPQTSDFYPDIPGDTVVPARGFGLQAGAHVYPVPLGSRRIGFGVDLFWARGTATTPVAAADPSGGADTVAVAAQPDVAAATRVVSPQVSINFGTARGWSYLTLGAGRATIDTTAGAARRSTSVSAVNAGGGARWFVSDHVGVGFDLRGHWLRGRAQFAASAGFSFK